MVNNKKAHPMVKGIDAYNAGKANRNPCILYITDENMRAILDNNIRMDNTCNQIGLLALGNTNWNDIKDDLLSIAKNDEINELNKMIGLIKCHPNELATYYANETNFKKLRYDSIKLMTDNQTIIDLVTGYFNKYFPSLVVRNFITS